MQFKVKLKLFVVVSCCVVMVWLLCDCGVDVVCLWFRCVFDMVVVCWCGCFVVLVWLCCGRGVVLAWLCCGVVVYKQLWCVVAPQVALASSHDGGFIGRQLLLHQSAPAPATS